MILGKVDGGFAGITNTYSYNNRLQPSAISAGSTENGTVLDLSYKYVPVSDTSCTTSGTVNNGNVTCIANNVEHKRDHSFTYDYLNRLATAQSSPTSGDDCWGQSFTYDSTYYTNLASITSTKCSAQQLSLSITNKNRISNSGFTYDDAGNLTADGVYSYSWNAENRLTSTNGVDYTYDGHGQRVKKDQTSGSDYDKLYWYGLAGEVLVETELDGDLLREFIYFGGAKVARRDADGTAHYFFADHLGTNRVMTSATGVTQQESTYYPFGGEQREITSTVDNRWKFTGLERDSESGLDNTLFRKYASNLARWLSPDPICGSITNPQSLNRYSYVVNNPTNMIDPLGLFAGPRHRFLLAPAPTTCPPQCGYGDVLFGNNIFDAIMGAPGTYLTLDMYGNLGWGFSIDLWKQTWAVIDNERAMVAQMNPPLGNGYYVGIFDPSKVPTTGYTVLYQDFGTPDINSQYSATGIVPDLIRSGQEFVQLGAMLPASYQQRWHNLVGAWGPPDAVFRFSNYLQGNDPASYAAWAPYGATYLNNLLLSNDSWWSFVMSSVGH
jgi:RHS repeat-associated protein